MSRVCVFLYSLGPLTFDLPKLPVDIILRFYMGNSVVTDVQFGHLFLVCIKYVALQEVTCG